MARQTLTEMAGAPLVIEDDAFDPRAYRDGDPPPDSLQHLLGLTPPDVQMDQDLESELRAELGVHGVNVEDFHERLHSMLDARRREHLMFEVQSRFQSVLESIEQLSRLTTGQVRYRSDRLTADAKQMVRVVLASRVAAERLDEALRSSEQSARQSHDLCASLRRVVLDAQGRVHGIETTAAHVESMWQQLQVQQAAAAPERALVLWCGVAAAIGAAAVVAAGVLLGFL